MVSLSQYSMQQLITITTCETFILLRDANRRTESPPTSPPKSPMLPAPAAESVAGEQPTSGKSSWEKKLT